MLDTRWAHHLWGDVTGVPRVGWSTKAPTKANAELKGSESIRQMKKRGCPSTEEHSSADAHGAPGRVLGSEMPSSFNRHNDPQRYSHHRPFSEEKEKEPTSTGKGGGGKLGGASQVYSAQGTEVLLVPPWPPQCPSLPPTPAPNSGPD